jgi:hypothetical protein
MSQKGTRSQDWLTDWLTDYDSDPLISKHNTHKSGGAQAYDRSTD